MKPIVIESPYAGDVERNLRYLDACIRDCLRRGETPYASHKMLTTALDDDDPEQRALGIQAGISMAYFVAGFKGADANAVAFYVDLGWSRGMTAALDAYKRDGHVRYETRSLGGEWDPNWVDDGGLGP